jgi:hypothetical protein
MAGEVLVLLIVRDELEEKALAARVGLYGVAKVEASQSAAKGRFGSEQCAVAVVSALLKVAQLEAK